MSQAGIDWDNAWQVKVNGQTFSVELFTSRLPPDAVMRTLVQGNRAYEHFQIAEGRILLSGLAAGRHWLAEIQGHPDGAQGYVSALYFRHDAGQHAIDAVAGVEAAARVFDFGASARVALAGGHSATVDVSLPEH